MYLRCLDPRRVQERSALPEETHGVCQTGASQWRSARARVRLRGQRHVSHIHLLAKDEASPGQKLQVDLIAYMPLLLLLMAVNITICRVVSLY